jgi:hypothetical protein
MAADERECVDLWSVLEDAETTVEGWPEWQRDVEADCYSASVCSPCNTAAP